MVTNQTGLVLKPQKHHPTTIDTLSIVDFLRENTIDIRRVFAPEHGFRGEADAGEYVKNGVDTKTGIPIISLYGKNKNQLQNKYKI